MRILQATALALLVWAPLPVSADEPAQQDRYTIKQTTPDLGSNIPRGSVHGDLPFDKTYAQLTPEQKNAVKAQYESMAEDDEPPFPALGLGPLYKAIADLQQRLVVTGALVLYVQINELGEAVSVSVMKSPSDQMTRYAAQVAMLTKFKPAVCAGRPCAMQFPIRIDMQRRL